ncbi:YhgE/Pip family protein [Streptomyces zagrosensis]|uniref:Putative membrane protein n=1 Tax=Streptomyces zagrosensis TaxID=1042984 RepID=A0A7W9UWF1_9ACTN|nr:YhgE/Pip domain-containing protein [Streptomyces zagrosensis]MBB5933467.1 putative membrane protein [Streptomyces zagrosensis]
MRSPKLAALELKRFGRGKLPRAALAAILLLPLLYGALYLWSFWDPYDRLDKIPVALVNADKGATVGGEKMVVGDELVKGLRDSNTFEWHETTAEQARKGVEKGTYYLSLTVPSHFSNQIASSSGDAPETGALKVRTNDANNYIVGQISRTVFSEVRAAASSKASRGFYDKIFVSFSDIHGKTAEAAKGADKLGDGIGKAKDGADKIHKGLDKAEKGSKSLSGGVTKLHTGSGRLKTGAGDVAEGTQQLADKVNGAYRDNANARRFLTEHGKDIGDASQLVADASRRIGGDLDTLPASTTTAATKARTAADDLAAEHRSRCTGLTPPTSGPTGGAGPSQGPGTASPKDTTGPSDPAGPHNGSSASAPGAGRTAPGARSGAPEANASLPAPVCDSLNKAVDAADSAADVAEDLDTLVHKNTDGLDKLARDLDDVHDKAAWLAQHAPNLSRDIDAAVTKINALNAGAHKVAAGAGQLHGGLSTAKTGASSLHTGVDDLHTGAGSLDGGLFKLVDGSGKLSGGLHDGVKKIPDYGKQERDARTEVMADPVQLASQSMHAAPNYGTGFAPYFIPLSLWVGAMVAYMLIQPLNRRALAAGASPLRITLAGWLPVAAIGAVQTMVLMSVLHWGLGLEMARAAGTVGFLLLVTCCFAAIVQWLNARFGPAGRILVLALLMLQLTSAGGTYPVQTSPAFFNALHPLLPMSYIVEALRRLITGGGLEPVWQGSVVLLAFTVGALALTTVSARRKQVWSIDRLHPELTL